MNKKVLMFTDRLKIKTLQVADITLEYINGLNNLAINKYLVNVRLKRQTHKTIKEFIKTNLNSSNSLLLGLFTKDKNELIGTVRIHDISCFHYSCSVGICIFNKKYWGKGYAQEALKKVMKYIFKQLELHYVEAGAYKENKVSVNLFKKCGFRVTASFKNKYRHINSFKEVVLLGKMNPKFNYEVLKK